MWNLIRWVSPRTIKETFVPPTRLPLPVPATPRSGDGVALKRPLFVVALALLARRRLGSDRGADPWHDAGPTGCRPSTACATSSPAARGYDLATVDGLDRVARDCEVRHAPDLARPVRERREPARDRGRARLGRLRQDGGRGLPGRADLRRRRAQHRLRGLPRQRPHLARAASSPGSTPRGERPARSRTTGGTSVWLAVSLVFGGAARRSRVSRSTRHAALERAGDRGLDQPEFGQDKEWIACDDWPQSPHYGNCYLSYSDTIGEEVIVADLERRRPQRGRAATTAPGFPGASRSAAPSLPACSRSCCRAGASSIAYYDEGKISVLRSDDGGATWTTAARDRPGRTTARTAACARRRCRPRPCSSDGRAYVAWTDCCVQAGCVRRTTSSTRPVHGRDRLSPVTRVPTGSGDAELPGLDARSLDVRAGSRSRTTSTAGRRSTSASSSSNAGASWSRPQLLNSRRVPMSGIAQTSLGSMVGDYISTSFAGGRAVPVLACFASAPRKWPARGCVRDLAAGPQARPALCELGVDGPRRPFGESPGDALQFLPARGEKPLRRAEVPQQRPPPRGADALQRVEDRLARLRVAALAVEAEREAVRLVADPLQQLQPGESRSSTIGSGLAGDEDLLLALRQRDHARRAAGRTPASPRAPPRAGPCRRRSRPGSASAANDSSYSSAGRRPAAARTGARRPPASAAKSSCPSSAAHAELAVVRLLRHRVLEDDHRADHRLALDVRDVVALDPQRQALEVQRLAQLLERLDPPQRACCSDCTSAPTRARAARSRSPAPAAAASRRAPARAPRRASRAARRGTPRARAVSPDVRRARRSAAARSAPSRSTRARTPRAASRRSWPSTFSRWKP